MAHVFPQYTISSDVGKVSKMNRVRDDRENNCFYERFSDFLAFYYSEIFTFPFIL